MLRIFRRVLVTSLLLHLVACDVPQPHRPTFNERKARWYARGVEAGYVGEYAVNPLYRSEGWHQQRRWWLSEGYEWGYIPIPEKE